MCVYERGRDGQLKRQAEVCVCVCMREVETQRDGQLKRQAEVCVRV